MLSEITVGREQLGWIGNGKGGGGGGVGMEEGEVEVSVIDRGIVCVMQQACLILPCCQGSHCTIAVETAPSVLLRMPWKVHSRRVVAGDLLV